MGYASLAGRAKTSATNPQAHAICDRCGFRYNLVSLRWQYDWRGTSLQNLRLLVCNRCYDEPQEQLRAIVVPADPVPVQNPRLQDFVTAETNNRYTSGTYLVPLSCSGNGTTVTLTMKVPSTFPALAVNSMVVVSGMVPDTLNGTYFLTAVSAGSPYTISYANNTVGSLVTAGKVLINVDRNTGIPIVNGDNRITMDDNNRVTQMTGEPPGGLNQEPGTSPTVPAAAGGNDPGLPYNFVQVPKTGPLNE